MLFADACAACLFHLRGPLADPHLPGSDNARALSTAGASAHVGQAGYSCVDQRDWLWDLRVSFQHTAKLCNSDVCGYVCRFKTPSPANWMLLRWKGHTPVDFWQLLLDADCWSCVRDLLSRWLVD